MRSRCTFESNKNSTLFTIALGAILFLAGGRVFADPAVRAIPHPLPSHPGNIFFPGEAVTVAEPPGEVDTWRLVNYEGHQIATGPFKDGKAELGPLPVGWYKIVRGVGHWTNRVSLAVIEPLRAPTPPTSPIGIDVAMAWFFDTNKMPDVINLCQLAGMNRVRDRMSWPEVEPQRGQFAAHTRYDDSLRLQTEAGLQVLQVNHISPPWAGTNAHFPGDLRDVYNTYRTLAARWHGHLEAFEPWNEADIIEFGGHMGSEMATLQKAAYLGMKAGDPSLTVCENVFAIHRAETLADFRENKAWAYFDTFNVHHYDQFRDYPKMWSDFRATSAGKPMWVTECNVIVPWADELTKEPDDANLHLQAERVPMIYSLDIYNGAQAVFYFMLPHYVEYRRQYGLLRPDLTPRPSYLSACAAGRFLADAKPIGRINQTNNGMEGYLFKTLADGKKTDVLVVWAETNTTLTLPKAPLARFNELGCALKTAGPTVKIHRAPQYLELAPDALPAWTPPPTPAKYLTGSATPVVLQAQVPVSNIDYKISACKLPAGDTMTVPIVVYNFGKTAVRGKLKVQPPEQWTARIAEEITVAAGGRAEATLQLTHPARIGTNSVRVLVTGKFNHGGGSPLVSFHLAQE